MSSMRQRPFRPGFDHSVDASPAKVRGAIVELVESQSNSIAGRLLDEHLLLTTNREARHFWSPWLHLEIKAHRTAEVDASGAANKSYVRGFFTPHPSLWTGYMLTYIALGTLVFFSAIWGVIQLQMSNRPLALWVAAACILLAALMVWAARVGQRLAAEQMTTLHDHVERALASSGHVSPGGGEPV